MATTNIYLVHTENEDCKQPSLCSEKHYSCVRDKTDSEVFF